MIIDIMKEKYCVQCGRIHYEEGQYCKKHSSQISKFGKCLDANPRDTQDRHSFKIVEDYIRVDLYSSSGNKTKSFLADFEDIQLILDYTFVFKNNKVMIVTNSGMYPLANVILGVKLGTTIEYRNKYPLNLTRENLIVRERKKNSTYVNWGTKNSPNKGIYKNRYGRFYAEYCVFDKRYISHLVRTKEEALFARYILEQMFSPTPIPPAEGVYAKALTIEQKETIISKLKHHYNK